MCAERDEAEPRVSQSRWLCGCERTEGVREEEEEEEGKLPLCVSGCRESLDGVICSTMGCSLCTLQKPEEQYKLLYEVCQVL